jgi:hypothetical protein
MSMHRRTARHARPPKAGRAMFERLSDALDQARARYWALAARGAPAHAFKEAADEYERANAEFGELIRLRERILRRKSRVDSR